MIQVTQIPNLGAYGYVSAPTTNTGGNLLRFLAFFFIGLAVLAVIFFWVMPNFQKSEKALPQQQPQPPIFSDDFLPMI